MASLGNSARPWMMLALLAALLPGTVRAQGPAGVLSGPVRRSDGSIGQERQVYVPRAGDLIIYSEHSVMWRVLFALAWTGPPFHSGIVIERPDGRMAVLEAGAYDTNTIQIIDLLPRLRSHVGEIWVRRLRKPLGPEQSARLTAFAQEQTRKHYALARVTLEITPFRAHGPIHSRLFGSSRLDRDGWYCSELAIAGAAVAGLVNPQVIKPNTVYPRDMYWDRPYDFSPWWEGPARWWDAP